MNEIHDDLYIVPRIIVRESDAAWHQSFIGITDRSFVSCTGIIDRMTQ